MNVTVLEILREIDAATERMSKTNPHRFVLLQAGAAILELAQRANGLEAQHLATPEQVEASA